MGVSKSRVLHRSLRETLQGDRRRGRLADWRGRKADSGCVRRRCRLLSRPPAPRVLEAMARQASKLAYATPAFSRRSRPKRWLTSSWATSPAGSLTPISSAAARKRSKPASAGAAVFYRDRPAATPALHRTPPELSCNTLGALAAGGNAWRREPYAPLLSSAFSHVTPAFAYHENATAIRGGFVVRLAAELERSSSVSARRTWRRSSPNLLWARPPAACRRRRDIFAPSARSATGTARSSSSTR